MCNYNMNVTFNLLYDDKKLNKLIEQGLKFIFSIVYNIINLYALTIYKI